MEITVLIKTMMRPKSLKRLIRSLLKYYPDICIMIADDGIESSKSEICNEFADANIEYYELPHDSGLSYGRNYLLERVNTPYFLLCDDDFVIDSSLNLNALMDILNKKNLDILGGYIRNYKIVKNLLDRCIVYAQKVFHYEICTNYIGSIEHKDEELIVHYRRKAFPEYEETDLCPNFFIAKTKRIKEMGGWDNDLKLQEHTEFFLRAKEFGIRVGSTNQMSVKHFPIQNKDYSSKRGRDFSSIFLKKHGIEKAYYYYDESERNVIEYFDSTGALVCEPMKEEV